MDEEQEEQQSMQRSFQENPETTLSLIKREPYYAFKTPQLNPLLSTESPKFKLIVPHSEDIKFISEEFNKNPPQNYSVDCMFYVCLDSSTENIFQGRIPQLNSRKDEIAFEPKWETYSSSSEELNARRQVYQLCSKKSAAHPDFPVVNIFLGWHGVPNLSVAESIFRTAFANLGTTDLGFYGKGLYATSEAEYAANIYAKGSNGADTLFLIFVQAAFYSAYPVIKGDKANLEGKGNYSNYDAHFIPVDPYLNEYGPAFPIEKDRPQGKYYTELVVFEASQLRPLVLVVLRSHFFGSHISNTKSIQVKAVLYYLKGREMEKQERIKEAITQFELSAKNGYTPAIIALSNLKYNEDLSEAIQYLEEHHPPQLIYNIALHYKDKNNILFYFKYLNLAAEGGHEIACYELGVHSLKNKNFTEIPTESYLLKASALEDTAYYLCRYYVIQKNLDSAEKYYKKYEKSVKEKNKNSDKKDEKASQRLKKLKNTLKESKKNAELEIIKRQLETAHKAIADLQKMTYLLKQTVDNQAAIIKIQEKRIKTLEIKQPEIKAQEENSNKSFGRNNTIFASSSLFGIFRSPQKNANSVFPPDDTEFSFNKFLPNSLTPPDI